jgi:hypothetical protein
LLGLLRRDLETNDIRTGGIFTLALSQQEYDAIISDRTKVIEEDIVWEGPGNSPTREFRIDIDSSEGYPIFIKGWYNPRSGKLSFSIIHRTVGGRIYGLDLGAEHYNPDGKPVGEKHKNYWVSGYRDKWAYVPDDITGTWDRPIQVWEQFCAEVSLSHSGTIRHPDTQGGMPI